MEYNIKNAVIELNEKKVIKLVKAALDSGVNPNDIIDEVDAGMMIIGELYQEGKVFIADLMMSGIIFKKVLKITDINKSEILNSSPSDHIGTIVIGSAYTDKHDIGKDIFISMARAAKFKVIDLGIDVSAEVFFEALLQYHPDIVGISALLTSSIIHIKNTLNEDARKFTGADAYTKKASDGLRICLSWVNKNGQN
jgi:methanogenic corrinoid protein MtbC1